MSLKRTEVKLIHLDYLEPNPYQPRQEFNDEELNELAESIKKNGLLQKITVLPKVDDEFNIIPDKYYILAGERRVRAYKLLYKSTGEREYSAIEALVDNIGKLDPENYRARLMISSLAENLNRKDLTPVEKAEAIKKIQKETGQTYKQIGVQLGYKESYIKKIVSITNKLTDKQKEKVKKEKLGGDKIAEMTKKNSKRLPAGNLSKNKENLNKINTLKKAIEEKEKEVGELRKKLGQARINFKSNEFKNSFLEELKNNEEDFTRDILAPIIKEYVKDNKSKARDFVLALGEELGL